MAKRSLKASSSGIAIAKRAFERREWTQEYLASAVGLQTRQSIWKFFTGRPIERYLFVDICFQLDLDWEEIVDRPPLDDNRPNDAASNDATALADRWAELAPVLREQCRNQIRSLMSRRDHDNAVALADLYVQRSFSTQPTAASWLDAATLEQQSQILKQSDFRGIPLLGAAPSHYHPLQIAQRSTLPDVPSCDQQLTLAALLSQYHQLQICGPLGSGKSTLLQAIAWQQVSDLTDSDILPIYCNISDLKILDNKASEATEPNRAATFNLAEILKHGQGSDLTPALWQWLLDNGKIMLLLDNADRAAPELQGIIQQQITDFGQSYPQTPIILTNRYVQSDIPPSQFFAAYLCPLNHAQIRTFATQWFASLAASSPNMPESFLNQLFDKRYQRLRQLATSPMLLNIVCRVFRDCQRLPENRSRLYQHLLEVHLQRGTVTDRHTASPTLLTPTNCMNLLSHLAYQQFQMGQYFFERNTILALIVEYLGQWSHRPNPSEITPGEITPEIGEPETLWQTAETVLTQLTIDLGMLSEAARGIYCFTHLALQEYLTAHHIFTQTLTPTAKPPSPQAISPILPRLAQKLYHRGWHTQQALYNLASHVLDPRWHEVILLSLDLLPQRQTLLDRLQQQSDRVILLNPRLKQFFAWLEAKVEQVHITLEKPLNPAALRAFYCGQILNLGVDLACSLEPALTWQPPTLLTQDTQLIRLCHWSRALITEHCRNNAIQICFSLQTQIARNPNITVFTTSLETLQTHLATAHFEQWPTEEREVWATQLEAAITQHYNVGHHWALGEHDWQQLEAYYWSNVFRLECLQRYQQAAAQYQTLLQPRAARPRSLAVLPNTTLALPDRSITL